MGGGSRNTFYTLGLRTFFILFLFIAGGFLFAGKAEAGTITGTDWPTSGAASAGTTGFSAVTGGTHVGSTDLPSSSESTGYITGADDGALTFRVDSTTVPLQTDNDYWLRFWVRANQNETTLAADGTSITVQRVNDASTELTNNWYLKNSSTSKGFGIMHNEFLPGGSSAGVIGVTAANLPALVPLNQWSEITLHLHKDGKDGEYAVYFNRSLIRLHRNIATIRHTANFTADATADTVTSAGHSMVEEETVTLTTTGTLPAGLAISTTYYVRNPTTDTFQLSLSIDGAVIDITDTGTGTHTYSNGGITLASLGSKWTMSFGGINGITWQLAGQISTSSAATIDNTPLVDMFTRSTDWITKIYPSAYNDLTYGGDFWKKTAGAMSVTATAYSSGGVGPARSRFVLSGSAADTATVATAMDVGVLPYNSFGWATLYFPMIYLPGSGGLNVVVKNPVGDTIYQVDIDNGYLKQNGVNLVPWVPGDRYFIALHFSNTGKVNYSMDNLSQDVTTQNFWSGQLADWTPQTIGRMQYVAIRGTTDLELDGLEIARWLPLFGLDSLTESPGYQVTPSLAVASHVVLNLSGYISIESSMLPGASYIYRSSNLPRFYNRAVIGRTGRTRQNYTDNVLPYMTYSRGIVMSFVDGGSINDIASINSDESARTTVVNRLLSQLDQAVSQLIGNQNRVWLTTMINRVQGSSYTATERNAILDYDAGIRTLWQSYPSTYLSDPATDIADPSTLFTAGDDTHFNSTGDTTYAANMITDMVNDNTTPFLMTLGPSTVTDGSISTNTTPTFSFVSDDGNEDVVLYELQIDNNTDFSSPNEDYYSPFAAAGSSSHTASSLPDGSYYWRVRVSDNTATSTWSQANGGAVAFTIDTTAPSSSASPSGATYSNIQSVSLSCSDATSGCDKIYYTTNGLTPTTSSSIYSSPVTMASGYTSLKFFATDLAGNSETVKTENYSIITGSVSIFSAPAQTPTPIPATADSIKSPLPPLLKGENAETPLTPLLKGGNTAATVEMMLSEALRLVQGRPTEILTNFIANGTPTTLILGSGERSGVVNSFKSAFGRTPQSEADWSDVIKIANGRWPSQRNAKTEANAEIAFKKIYLRAPNMQQFNDNAAVTIISYGLRPANRNLNSERAAIKSFMAVYGHTPKSAMAWDIVRAIAYSGARR